MTKFTDEEKKTMIDEHIKEMVNKGRAAMEEIEDLTQEDVRDIARAIAYLAVDRATVWAKALYTENGGSGVLESKITRDTVRPLGMAAQLDDVKTVGVLEEDPEGYLAKIAKPLGVVASLVPMTVPDGLVSCHAMFSIMSKDAMIFSPHPRTKKMTNFIVADLRELMRRMGYPEDLFQCVEMPSIYTTEVLMKNVDFVVATGGANMVKAAYSSGTPAFGVGAGNSCSYVDDTADLEEVASGIKAAEMNDWGAGCSTENSAVINESIYDETVEALKKAGGYLCTSEEKKLLEAAIWKDGKLNTHCIIHSPQHIAEYAGFKVPESCNFLMAEETQWGAEHMMTEEKLSPVIALWKVKNVDEAIKLINNIHSISGAGHSCSIHSTNEDHILKFASKTKTSRVAVNTNTGLNNAGAYNNKMPWTFTLGCGSWGGNAFSENNSFKHYHNTTWVYRMMPGGEAPDKEAVFKKERKHKEWFADYPDFEL